MSEAKAIKRHTAQYDLFNRLHSIASDQSFVKKVEQEWFGARFEVVPNQRCGNWYCDPMSTKGTYAYFKSTDGHTNNWQFNLRRSNLPLAKYIETQGGIILVDSTRRAHSKRMPDALSKTVPIWCAVINLAIQIRKQRSHLDGGSSSTSIDDVGTWDTRLYLPAGVVSDSERSQIEDMLNDWADNLESSNLPLPTLTKPLRPFFIHPSTSIPPQIPLNPPYTPIICLSASRWVGITGLGGDTIPTVTRVSGRNVGLEYVPGAGDDDEAWGRGLKPSLFWKNKTKLMNFEREDLVKEVDELVSNEKYNVINALGDFKVSSSVDTSANGDIADAETMSFFANPPIVGIPTHTSHLGVAIGPPIVPTLPWYAQDNKSGKLIITIIEIPKSSSSFQTIYEYSNSNSNLNVNDNHDDHIFVVVPNAKLDSRGYSESLDQLVSAIRKVYHYGQNVIIRPGTANQLNQVKIWYQSVLSLSRNDESILPLPATAMKGVEFEGEKLVEARKCIIPLVLMIILSIPDLVRSQSRETTSPDIQKEGSSTGNDIEHQTNTQTPMIITKSDIAQTLHQLITLWPDGNPPRVALRRVNEYLMS